MNNLTRITTLGFLSLGNLIFIGGVGAFTVTFSGTENLGFEDQYNGWTTYGDTTIQSTFQSISPQEGSSQALITNSCFNGVGSQCQDKDGGIRNDDSHINVTAGTFNYSSNDQINASIEVNNNLQSLLGISDNGLSIPATLNGSIVPGVFRTPKEGSAILSEAFTVDSTFDLSFDWNYLTNDGASTLGNQDFSFVTITGTTSGGDPIEQIIPLGDSSGAIPSGTNNTLFSEVNGYETYNATALEPGTYQVGFGVVDVDNVDRSSGLLVDNLSFTENVPFEFSPTLGLLFIGSMFGVKTTIKKMKSKAK